MIVSVDRITDHLSRLEGKEEESKILHEFFHSEPVQAAIEAIAVHRTSNDGVTSMTTFSCAASEAFSLCSGQGCRVFVHCEWHFCARCDQSVRAEHPCGVAVQTRGQLPCESHSFRWQYRRHYVPLSIQNRAPPS